MQPGQETADVFLLNPAAVDLRPGEFVWLAGVALSLAPSGRPLPPGKTALTRTVLEAWRRWPDARDDRSPLGNGFRIVRDCWGKPGLILDTGKVLSVSYSYGAGGQWAALAPEGVSVGVDVAAFCEFEPGYPFSRVFHQSEWNVGLERTGGDPAAAGALLWSCKEAAVKALGQGFHLVEPFALRVEPNQAASPALFAECIGCEPIPTMKALGGPWQTAFTMTVGCRLPARPVRLKVWTAHNLAAWFSVAVERQGGSE